MSKIPGTLTKINDTQFKFTPDSDLEVNTKYKINVAKNFRSEDGIELGEKLESVFTTIDEPQIDVDYIQVVGGGGEVWELRTYDDVWTQKASTNELQNNRSIDFLDEDNGLVSATPTEIFSTDDSSDTFSSEGDVTIDGYVETIQKISSTVAICIVFNGTSDGIYRTIDNGANWTLIESGNFYSLEMLNSSHGIACSYQEILTTNDGGLTWT